MDWDRKVKLARLGSTEPNSEDFKDFALEVLDELDPQGASILLNVLELDPGAILTERAFFERVHQRLSEMDLPLRDQLRLKILGSLLET